ncbi:MAG: hypothetical protein MUP98_11300, partial [Candidatus Aminicenantes bacterium]|nr:hypothetical protein [Candidatus Aminicenantes bacterium]
DSLEGKFEIDVHYSTWSINLLKSWFETELNKSLGGEIRDEVYHQIRDSYAGIYTADYEDSLVFDSNGNNFGVEFRFYPKGRGTPFSFGVSIEKNEMNLIVQGTLRQNFSNGSYAEVASEGFLKANPILTNLSFQWDMVPHWPVSPYFVLGFGFGTLRGEIGYNYTGTYTWAGPSEQIEDEVTKTFAEAEEEFDVNLPNIFPLFQAGFGLRIQLFPALHLKAEASFWNGFILRAGAAFRF